MVGSALGRVIVVSMAFIVSAAAAIFVFVTLGLEHASQAMYGEGGEGLNSLPALMDFLWQAYVLTSTVTLLPALAVVLIGEVGRIRSVLYYVAGGGAASTLFPLLAYLGPSPAGEPTTPVVWQVLATAGFVGGFVYWLLAGRRA
jgi:hypothetical protein